MNREELRLLLAENRVKPKYYELDGRPADLAYVLESKDGKWYVYYTERGGKFDEHWFESEADACEYIFRRLTHTQATRMRSQDKQG